MGETDDLIERLAGEVGPMRRLRPPWQRALIWLALSAPPVALVIWQHGLHKSPDMLVADARFVVEAIAVFATAVLAAIAAFACEVPGMNRRWLWAPLVPFAVWLLALGQACAQEYAVLGAQALALRSDESCLEPAILGGVIPAILMAVMLARGAPVMPKATLAFGGLAVAALVNLGLIFFHAGDASIMVLVWHGGATVMVAAAATLLAPPMLNWGRTRA